MVFHSIKEGFKNLFRSFWLSITAIFIIFVSLSSVALVSSTWVASGFALRQFDRQAILYVNLNEDSTQEAVDIMLEDIENSDNVKSVQYIGKEEAKEELKNDNTVGDGIQKLDTNSEITKRALDRTQASFKIIASSAEDYDEVVSFVQDEKYVQIVKSLIDISNSIETIQNIYNITSIIGVALVGIFALISVLVMINILRIAIYSKKAEIEIMRLVGATNSYIRWPFVVEGIFYNLIATFFNLLIFIPTIIYFAPRLANSIDIDLGSSNLLLYLYITFAVVSVANLLVGAICSYLTTQKYLKL